MTALLNSNHRRFHLRQGQPIPTRRSRWLL